MAPSTSAPSEPARMTRTCIFLPDDLRERLRAAAADQRTPMAQLIRAALQFSIGAHRPPPKGGFLVAPSNGDDA